MQLIGIGEERLFGRSHRVFAIFQKPDGKRYHMELSVPQLAGLLAASGQMEEEEPLEASTPPRRPQPQPQQSPLVPPGVSTSSTLASDMSDDDDEDDLPPIRIAGLVHSDLGDQDPM